MFNVRKEKLSLLLGPRVISDVAQQLYDVQFKCKISDSETDTLPLMFKVKKVDWDPDYTASDPHVLRISELIRTGFMAAFNNCVNEQLHVPNWRRLNVMSENLKIVDPENWSLDEYDSAPTSVDEQMLGCLDDLVGELVDKWSEENPTIAHNAYKWVRRATLLGAVVGLTVPQQTFKI